MTAETLYPGLDAISGVPLVASSCLARTAKTCKLLIEQRVRFGRRQGSHTLREESAMSWTCRTNCATSTARCSSSVMREPLCYCCRRSATHWTP